MRKRTRIGKLVIILPFIIIAILTACNLPSSGQDEVAEGEPIIEEQPPFEEMSLEEALAIPPEDRRETVLTEMGAPDTFTLKFEELEGSVVRWEEWSYFEFDSRFDFIDGELIWTVELEPMPDGSIYAHFYDPYDFRAYMSEAEVRALLGDQELTEIDLTEGDIAGGLALAGDQILMGFDHDRLVYVETFALTAGEPGEVVALLPTQEQSEATAAPTFDPQTTATTAATPIAAPVGPPTNTPVPGQPAPRTPGELLFEDNFQSAGSAVPLFGADVMTLDYADGVGVMTAQFPGGVLAGMYPEPKIQDFIMDLEISVDDLAPGSRVGVIFRSDDIAEGLAHYYHLVLGPTDGTVGIDMWKDGGWALQKGDTISRSLLPPTGTHRLRLETEGSNVRVFLNGTFVFELADQQLPDAGIIGLSMVSAAPPERAAFDNLKIYALP